MDEYIKKRRIKIIRNSIIAVLVFFIGLLLIKKPWQYLKIMDEYNAAWQLDMDGKYREASDKFMCLMVYEEKEYTSVIFGWDFSVMCSYYERGDYRKAKSQLDYNIMPELNSKTDYPKLNEEQDKFVWKMVYAVRESYASHKAIYDEEDRRAEAEREAERRKAPYVGMSESKIDSTDLGKHSKYYEHFNTECIGGEIYDASMYYWYSGGDCIYSARCVRGFVSNISDNRDHHISESKSSSSSTSTKKKSEESTTEFDPDDHDIEQYYEDYKDEEGFDNIDDAYDDFEDHPEYWDDY